MPKILRVLLMLCIGAPVFGCATQGAQTFSSGVTEYQTVFSKELREGVACYRIPALMTAPDGSLVAVADERVESCSDMDRNRDINIVMRSSRDHGKTWSPPTTIVDYPDGITASDPSLIADRITGGLFLFYNYMDHDTAPGIYRLHLMKSDDSGQTWEQPRDFTEQIIKPEWHQDFQFITSGNGSQTRAGTLLHTLATRRGAYVFASEDHGEHWSLKDTLLAPGDESRIVELGDGSWMVSARTNSKFGMRYTHVSKDQGVTWESRPEPMLVDPACNAGLVTCARDDAPPLLLFSNANSATSRVNLTIRYSVDNGTTWSVGRTVYPGAAAYSVLSILPDGSVGLLFEKDGYREITFVQLGLDWILAD